MSKKRIQITKLLRITAGKMHGWYETDKGYIIRKPLGNAQIATITPPPLEYGVEVMPPERSIVLQGATADNPKCNWWQVLWHFIKSFFSP